MSDTDNDQKTEKPTAKKLSEAADKGQFAKSPELSVLFTLAAAIAVLGFTANATAVSVAEYSVGMFSTFAHSPVEAATVPGYIADLMRTIGGGLLQIGRAHV